jgi:hypothetical protein
MPPVTVGLVLAIICVVLCVLGVLGVLPASPQVVFALIGVVALTRVL